MPCDQHQQFTITLGKACEGRQGVCTVDHGLGDVRFDDALASSPPPQFGFEEPLARLTPISLEYHVARDAEQPGQRIGGMLVWRRHATANASLTTSSAAWRPTRLTA
jgi:hypothetical protein